MKYLGKSEQGVHPLRVHALIFLSALELSRSVLDSSVPNKKKSGVPLLVLASHTMGIKYCLRNQDGFLTYVHSVLNQQINVMETNGKD